MQKMFQLLNHPAYIARTSATPQLIFYELGSETLNLLKRSNPRFSVLAAALMATLPEAASFFKESQEKSKKVDLPTLVKGLPDFS
jgi:hypothetical protein